MATETPAPATCRGDEGRCVVCGDERRYCPVCKGRLTCLVAPERRDRTCLGCGRLWRQDPECLRLVAEEMG